MVKRYLIELAFFLSLALGALAGGVLIGNSSMIMISAIIAFITIGIYGAVEEPIIYNLYLKIVGEPTEREQTAFDVILETLREHQETQERLRREREQRLQEVEEAAEKVRAERETIRVPKRGVIAKRSRDNDV